MTFIGGIPEKQGCHAIHNDKSGPDIPLNLEKRKVTDKWFCYTFIFCIALLVPFLIYTFIHSDINRYNGYDHCGNVCGQKNVRYDQWNCTGQDMTLKPLYYSGECLNEETFNSTNLPSWYRMRYSFFTFFKSLALRLTLIWCIPLGLSVLLALLFRHMTTLTVWIVLVTCWLFLLASTVYLWMVLLLPYGGIVLIYTLMAAVLFCISIPKKNHVSLTGKLIKAASKSVLSSRTIIVSSAMALITSSTILISYWIITFYISSAGRLTEYSDGSLIFILDYYMMATLGLNIIIDVWLVLFIIGIVSVISSGAIASIYFSRNKDSLTGIMTLKYHTGTVALVSLLSTTMLIPRLILIILAQVSLLKGLTDYCLRYLDGFFFKDAYIMTAMHGTSFCKSGKKAVELSRASIGNTESLNYFGNSLLILTQSLIVVVSCLISFSIDGPSVLRVMDYFILLPVSYISSEFILGPFKVAMSTIFFCINQDNLLKKETEEPHGIRLEEFLKNSNELFSKKIEEKWMSSNLANLERF